MRLDRVRISNFRSIKDITLGLEPRCRVLVGINEAGKSNILRALSLLNTNIQPTDDDVRETAPDEDLAAESLVRYIFSLESADRLAISQQLDNEVMSPESQPPIVMEGTKTISLADIYDSSTEGIYNVDIVRKTRRGSTWAYPSTSKIAPGWHIPTPACPDALMVADEQGQTRTLKSLSLVHRSFCENVPPEFLSAATMHSVSTARASVVAKYVSQNLPECVSWRHSNEHLVPAQMSFEEFTTTPDICMPLKHAFSLAGVSDIGATVEVAQRRSNGIRNLLNRVANHATEHIHSVWPEYKGLNFDLRQNGDYLETSIKDVHNLYNFARRSDGFQRFISFLLMISAPTRSNTLSNVLILIDDPSAGLHPTGERHLRDELIRVSGSNYVVYSTHSIFMIDPDEVSRHLIVTRKDEVTGIAMAEESNLVDEEVLYNALGYSIFENLNQKNVVFEGWRDKILFRTAMSRVPREYSSLKKKVSSMGICHVEGVRDVRRVTPMLELARRACVIISDGDNVARQHQEIHAKERLYGNWLRYDELVPNFGAVTSEDFIKPHIIADSVTGIAGGYEKLSGLSFQPTQGAGQLEAIGKWLTKAGLSAEERKQFSERLKELLFRDLKATQVRPEYYEFVSALMDVLDLELPTTPASQPVLDNSPV